jgi:hypothetical protein
VTRLVRLPVDPWGDRCGASFWLRADLADGVRHVLGEVWSRGGLVTSHGAVRRPEEPPNPARSPVSLHYLGRAIDLCLWSGMQQPDDPYAIVRAGGNDERPLWRVFCACEPESAEVDTIDALLWRRGAGTVVQPRPGAFFDLTTLFATRSWLPISARSRWRTDYFTTEWWHFECRDGLEPGRSTFGAELAALWPSTDLAAMPVAGVLDHVWDGQRFAAAAVRDG